jgi:hypothetical protein
MDKSTSVVVRPDAQDRRPDGDVGEMARRLGRGPYLRTECRGGRVVLRSTISGVVVGAVQLDTGVLTVEDPYGPGPCGGDEHPGVRLTGRGARIDLRDAAGRRIAEELLHRLVGAQLYGRQSRTASP